MKYKIKNALVAGGTGFLGYSTAKLLLEKKIPVTALSSSARPLWLDSEIEFLRADLFDKQANFAGIVRQKDFDTLFYALGPDDRVIPPAPAYEFFYRGLVERCFEVAAAAKRGGIRRMIVFSSYFTYFDDLYGGKLAAAHPYIKARQQQMAQLSTLNSLDFEVMFLQLPYIFGTYPGKPPLWRQALLSHFDGMPVVMFPTGGGTAVVDERGVAEAAVAAAHNGEGGGKYAVVKTNMTFKELIKIMLRFSGDKRRYVGVPAFLCSLWTNGITRRLKKEGRESGLSLGKLMTGIQNKKFYLDYDKLANQLNYKEMNFNGGGDIIKSIESSMRACYPERFADETSNITTTI